jgi:hypothetical protein
MAWLSKFVCVLSRRFCGLLQIGLCFNIWIQLLSQAHNYEPAKAALLLLLLTAFHKITFMELSEAFLYNTEHG